jgi:DNA-binding protein H-NS
MNLKRHSRVIMFNLAESELRLKYCKVASELNENITDKRVEEVRQQMRDINEQIEKYRVYPYVSGSNSTLERMDRYYNCMSRF